MRYEVGMIELVNDTWAVYDGEGGTYSPDEADQIALAIIRMAEAVRCKNLRPRAGVTNEQPPNDARPRSNQ